MAIVAEAQKTLRKGTDAVRATLERSPEVTRNFMNRLPPALTSLLPIRTQARIPQQAAKPNTARRAIAIAAASAVAVAGAVAAALVIRQYLALRENTEQLAEDEVSEAIELGKRDAVVSK